MILDEKLTESFAKAREEQKAHFIEYLLQKRDYKLARKMGVSLNEYFTPEELSRLRLSY